MAARVFSEDANVQSSIARPSLAEVAELFNFTSELTTIAAPIGSTLQHIRKERFDQARDVALDRIEGPDPSVLTISWASAAMASSVS